jgi:hypothetical protein
MWGSCGILSFFLHLLDALAMAEWVATSTHVDQKGLRRSTRLHISPSTDRSLSVRSGSSETQPKDQAPCRSPPRLALTSLTLVT